MRLSRWFQAIVFLMSALPLRAFGQAGMAGSEFQVNTYTYDLQRDGAVASDGAGNFVVVWEGGYNQDGSGIGVFGQRFDATGAPLGSEFQINTYTDDRQQNAAVAADTAGNFVVTWESRFLPGDNNYGIAARRFDATGAPLGTQFQVNTYTTTRQFEPAIAADGAGNFVVVWTGYQDYGSSKGIFAQRFSSAGAALGGEFQINTFMTATQAYPAVAADSAGNFLVAWQSLFQDGSGRGIFGRRYNSAGVAMGSEFQVNSYTTGDQVYPSVASDGTGDMVVVWNRYGEGVYGQRYDGSGLPLGGEFQANANTTYFAQYPAVGADSSGNFVVTWERSDASGRGVFGRLFDGTGSAVGGEFRVNTYTSYNQGNSAVAARTGDFMVVWTSDDQDGADEGVFGQMLCTVTTCTDGDGCCPPGCNAGNDDDCPIPTTTTTTTSSSSSSPPTSSSTTTSSTTMSTTTTSTTLPPTDLLPGRIVIIKTGTLAKFVAKPDSGTFAPPTANPVTAGGALRMFDTGATAGDNSYGLAAARWKGLGNPAGSKGYKYKGAGSAGDPCKVVLVKSNVIKAVCKGTGITLTPPFTGDVGIILSIGATDRYCARFGGDDTKNDATLTKRKNAPAPGACP